MILDKRLPDVSISVLKALVNDLVVFGCVMLIYNAHIQQKQHHCMYLYSKEIVRYSVQVISGIFLYHIIDRSHVL